MKRRTLLAAVLAAAQPGLPVPALAQAQRGVSRAARIGFLSAAAASDPVAIVYFRRYLASLGWREGESLTIEERHGEGDPAAAQRMAGELVALRPDLIVTTGANETRLVAGATREIPVVFLQVVDPVALGVVASLARPGGNVTGAAATGQLLGGKRLELLAELLPADKRRVAFLANEGGVVTPRQLADLREQAPRHGFTVTPIAFRQRQELGQVLEAARANDAMLVPHDWILFPARRRIVAFAAAAGVPAIYDNRFSPMIGGLASYGADLRDNFRQGALYADRILRGAQPADLPVVLPNRVELVVNLTTVGELGLTVPPSLLARADEVIE